MSILMLPQRRHELLTHSLPKIQTSHIGIHCATEGAIEVGSVRDGDRESERVRERPRERDGKEQMGGGVKVRVRDRSSTERKTDGQRKILSNFLCISCRDQSAGKTERAGWLIVNLYSHQSGLSAELKRLCAKLSYLPYVGVAVPLDDVEDFQGQVRKADVVLPPYTTPPNTTHVPITT